MDKIMGEGMRLRELLAMFSYPPFWNMNFCYKKKCSVAKSLSVLYNIEEIEKIF